MTIDQIKLVLLVILLFLNGCSQKSQIDILQSKQVFKKRASKKINIEYKILPQDRLKIILYREAGQDSGGKLGEDLNPTGILVNTSGYIKLPLIGKVRVAGLTQTQASDKIEYLYKKHLTNPTVYLEILNKRLFVLGEVKKQGVIKIDKEKMTLFEAIAFAGGFTNDAIRDNILILSHNSTGMHIRKVDLTNFDDMSYSDIILYPNDIVYIKPTGWKKFRVASGNYTEPFTMIAKIASPFVTLKYLKE